MSKHWNPAAEARQTDWGGGSPRRRPSSRRFGLQLAIGLAIGMVATSAIVGAGWTAAEPGDPRAVRVIDGDTFDHGAARIRMADIDTSELNGRCAYESRLAATATSRLGALLAAGPFELAPNPDGRDEDRYGRKLRIVTRNGRSLGGVLVAEGLARRWTGHREPWC